MDFKILCISLSEDINEFELVSLWSFLTTDMSSNYSGILFVSTSTDGLDVLRAENIEIPYVYLVIKQSSSYFFVINNYHDVPLVTCDLAAWNNKQTMICDFICDFFKSKTTRALSGVQSKLPQCPDLSTERSVLPPLLSKEGITDFPTKGENKKINFNNSQFKMFPFKKALELALAHPKAWCSGGNHFGNKAFSYWIQTMDAIKKKKPIPVDCQRWIKKRERYIARHTKDFRLAGVVAMIKWAGFVDGPHGEGNGAIDGSSLQYMVDLFNDQQ